MVIHSSQHLSRTCPMSRYLSVLALLAASLPATAQQSAVISNSDAALDEAEWGTFRSYFAGESYGTRDLLAGVAVIRGGDEIHPPHRHAEEEFLIVTRGEGVWHLNGEEFPAQAGDMLYARPWDVHGITNTGSDSLAFVVWKWSSMGLPAPTDPGADPASPEEEIQAAIAALSAATAPGGGGPDAYGAVLTEDFSRWTLGEESVSDKAAWLEGMRSWFDDGWRVADRETEQMSIHVEGDRAFVRRVVSETYRGPDGSLTDPARAAVSEVWVSTAAGWKLQRVEVTTLPSQ